MPAEFTTALGRLLTNQALRAEFRRDPRKAAACLDLSDADRDALMALEPQDLDRQAETLLLKRFHEVGKRMPRTFASLGGDAARRFRSYAVRAWPEGHDRHLRDAVAFGEFLLRDEFTGVSRPELHRLRFELEGGRWSALWIPDASIGAGLQILWRTRKGGIEAAMITFGFPCFRSPKHVRAT
jgi:hypothetical protein